jgi:seryl-tRNA(Sec) selenium transferase
VTDTADPLVMLAELLTAESACACSSLAGALLVAVAGSVAGEELAAVLRLPDAGDRECRVVVQRRHMVQIGGVALAQLLRLVGAVPVEVGTAEGCREDELAAMLGQGAACGLHIEQDGSADRPGIGMARFIWACRQAGVPSIVALLGSIGPLAALDAGADLVVLDVAHLYGGPALGLAVGRAERIAACDLQARGIGGLFPVAADALAAAIASVRAAPAELAHQPPEPYRAAASRAIQAGDRDPSPGPAS